MAKVTVTDKKLVYRKYIRACELPIENLVWAYLQQEDVSAKMCCGSFHAESYYKDMETYEKALTEFTEEIMQ